MRAPAFGQKGAQLFKKVARPQAYDRLVFDDGSPATRQRVGRIMRQIGRIHPGA